MIVKPHTKRFFNCVVCNDHEFSVEHVLTQPDRDHWRWVCSECGSANRFKVLGDGTLSVEHDADNDERYGLVVARVTNTPVFAIMRAIVTHGEDLLRFWLEEHTCPTNPEILDFVVDGNPDPHGMWQMIGIAPDWKRRGHVGHTHEILDHLRETAPSLYAILKGE